MALHKEYARNARDRSYRYFHQRMRGRDIADQLSVKLALDHPAVSDRMYYVLNKDYESRDAILASSVLNADSRVLELGASCGFMAIYCRSVIGVRDYAMVEPNPELPSLIERNFKLNGLDPDATPLIQAVAGPEDGRASFTVHRNIWSSSVIDRGGTTIDVPACTIPSIVERLPFTPDCLIADIEGGELFIPVEHYSGFSTILLETHPKLLADGADRTRELIAGLDRVGLKVVDRAGDSFVLTRSP